MNKAPFDTIVAGVGSVGSAACYHLAKRGAKVLGVEQFSLPHALGSHHGHSRMIRQAYYEHPDYVPLLRRAYELWEELQSSSTLPRFFYLTGGLYIGPDEGTIVAGSRLAAEQHGLAYEMLNADLLSERFPVFVPDRVHSGFYETSAGFLVPERAVAAHAEAATALGATIHTHESILDWSVHSDHVEVRTDKANYVAEQLVLTSGAWTGKVVADLGIDLKITRQVMAWFEPLGDRSRFAPDAFPCWFIETDPPFGHYGFPLMAGDPGLKVALHKPGEPIKPEDLSTEKSQPRQDEIERLQAILDEYLPGCAGGLTQACTCLYTNSPDSHFIIGKHPAHNRVSIACGLSGHGFKFSSVIGEALAELASDGRSRLPVDFLSPLRFS